MFFFLLPIRTDAPIYHWPYVTVSMIVLNLVLFVLTGFGQSSQIFPWSLHFGNGLIPYQWITCNFMHLGFSHVVGNMVALWSFGLVVEGKLGWWRYVLVYLGIGILISAILQIAMLQSEGTAAGASGIIFGLLAMTLVWAPKNEYGILFFFWFAFVVRAMVFDLSILNFSLLYLGLQLVIAILTGFVMSSEMIHLTGAAVGLACGIILLKLDVVDCENWDLFAVLSNTHGNRHPLTGEYYQATGTAITPVAVTSSGGVIRDIEPDPQAKLEVAEKRIEIRRKKLRRVRELLRSEKPQAALMEFEKLKVISPETQLGEGDLGELIRQLYKKQQYNLAVPLLEDYIERFPEDADVHRLRLALAVVQTQKRPRYGLQILRPIKPEYLSDDNRNVYEQTIALARRLIEEGTIELQGESWD